MCLIIFPHLLQVKLALEMRDLGVLGIDLSGNPVVGEWYILASYYSKFFVVDKHFLFIYYKEIIIPSSVCI